MDEIDIGLEWEGVEGSRGDELAATWARLSIGIGDSTITEVHDYRSRSIRRHVLVPVYPIAEWIASHWWSLLFEAETPVRIDYENRHNLRLGREGFALPDLLIKPTGQHALIEWRPTRIAAARLGFPGSGSCVLDLATVREAFADLIETVLARLDEAGITDTFLHQEWQGIQEADDEEAAFCAASARLGRDPYSLEDSDVEAILASAGSVPPQWQEEFFGTADLEHLSAQVALLRQARERVRSDAPECPSVAALREDTEKIDSGRAPWEQGYDVARKLRERLGLDGEPVGTDEVLADALSIPDLKGITLVDLSAKGLFDALVDSGKGGTPGFLTTKRRPEQVRFSFCRALFEYLTLAGSPSALITNARTDRQKRNRAFAAEFLAPAAWIRSQVSGTRVGPDEIDEWADELGVSTAVVVHQIENHRLAQVVGL